MKIDPFLKLHLNQNSRFQMWKYISQFQTEITGSQFEFKSANKLLHFIDMEIVQSLGVKGSFSLVYHDTGNPKIVRI